MAQAKIEDTCYICGKKLNEGIAIYITKVNLTTTGVTAPESGMAWGGPYKATPKGKLRIKYLGTSKPRYCIHTECYDKLNIKQYEHPRSHRKKHRTT